MNKYKTCPVCKGWGLVEIYDWMPPVTCSNCGGLGKVKEEER